MDKFSCLYDVAVSECHNWSPSTLWGRLRAFPGLTPLILISVIWTLPSSGKLIRWTTATTHTIVRYIRFDPQESVPFNTTAESVWYNEKRDHVVNSSCGPMWKFPSHPQCSTAGYIYKWRETGDSIPENTRFVAESRPMPYWSLDICPTGSRLPS